MAVTNTGGIPAGSCLSPGHKIPDATPEGFIRRPHSDLALDRSGAGSHHRTDCSAAALLREYVRQRTARCGPFSPRSRKARILQQLGESAFRSKITPTASTSLVNARFVYGSAAAYSATDPPHSFRQR